MDCCRLKKVCRSVTWSAVFYCFLSTSLLASTVEQNNNGKKHIVLTEQMVSISLQDAVSAALYSHPSIEASANEFKNKQSYIDVAKAAYYPQVSAGVRGGIDSSQQDNRSPPSAVLSISQMLYDFGKTKSAVHIEQNSTLEYKALLLVSIDEVIQQTANAMLELQRYQQLIAIAEDMETGIRALAELVERRHRSGAGTRSDLVQSYSRIEAAKAKKIEYQTQLERWKSRLNVLTGLDIYQTSTDSSRIDEINCESLQPDENLIPQLMQVKAIRERAQAQLKLSSAQQLPTLTLDPSVRHYIDDRPYTGNSQDDRTRYEVHLNFNMPLYQGGSLRARNVAANHALNSAEASINNAKLAIRQSLMDATSQQSYLSRHMQALKYREQLSAETRDLYRQQYIELGNRSLLDLLNAEQDIHQAKMEQHNLYVDQQQIKLTCATTGGILRNIFSLHTLQIHGVEIKP